MFVPVWLGYTDRSDETVLLDVERIHEESGFKNEVISSTKHIRDSVAAYLLLKYVILSIW